MDTKDIIANMDHNRCVLDAQYKRLNQLGARRAAAATSGVPTDPNELLATTVMNSFASAAEAIQALAEAEADVRRAASIDNSTDIEIAPNATPKEGQ
ncbi:MAG TPA: hypothetical protein VHU23_01640 [Rhizomicrobium sp.]|jgi:hypothetical protein|nr:hypothetical protein [Rhizomicrobium sp.]